MRWEINNVIYTYTIVFHLYLSVPNNDIHYTVYTV